MVCDKLERSMGSQRVRRDIATEQQEGWDGVGGRFKRKGTYAYLWLTHVDIWQKPILKQLSFNQKINK